LPNNIKLSPLLIFQASLVILVAVLPFSRALISISTGLIFASALAEYFSQKNPISFKNTYFICLASLVLLCILDGFRVYSVSEWVKSMEVKLPLLLLPFGYLVFRSKIKYSFTLLIAGLFCISISVSTIGSIFNYFINYEEINQLVLQSRHVPITGGMHHITFSVYCAFAVFVSSIIALKTGLKWFWIPAIINFIGLHVLTARTGLAGFYFALMVVGFIYFLNHKPKAKYLIASITMAILIPIIAFYSLGSFHNRVINTFEDLKVVVHQKDANYQSMGMRVEATRTAFDIIKKHPFLGVGVSNISHEMSAQYEENNSNLFLENRILPHMQLVMEAAVHGIVGLIILLIFFLTPFSKSFSELPVLFIILWSLIFFACFFECLFDRQHGIILVALFWFFFRDFKPQKTSLN